jgi:hypothetical protein
MLEEFLMPILDEEGPDDMLFQQDGAPPHFHKEVTRLLKSQISREMDWQRLAFYLATSFA